MSEVIVITSGKGGVGKTTTVANIGTGLAMLGKKVAVVDTDIGLRNLDVVLGLENRIVYNLVDVVNGSCRLRQALIRDKRHPELYLLPSAQTKDKTAVSPEQMIKLTQELREEFDYVLLDCPAGIEQGFKNAIAGADKAIVVTTPEVSAIRDADRIIGLLEAGDIRDIRLIINRLRPDMIARGDMMSVDDMRRISYMKSILREKRRSAGYARDRMKLLLISERIECSPQMIKMLRSDLIHTVKKYVVVEEDQVRVKISKDPAVIMAYIPVLTKKD